MANYIVSHSQSRGQLSPPIVGPTFKRPHNLSRNTFGRCFEHRFASLTDFHCYLIFNFFFVWIINQPYIILFIANFFFILKKNILGWVWYFILHALKTVRYLGCKCLNELFKFRNKSYVTLISYKQINKKKTITMLNIHFH